jgi:CHAT domain-containing protein/tetratricopeptide (TPR) repeat protein
MDDETRSNLLIRATAAYRRVVADPEAHGPEAVQVVADAREAGDAEALVAALRAQAWFERIRLAHDRATALLDEAVRVARRHHLDSRLGQALVTRGAVNHELGRLAAAKRDFDQAARLLGPAMDAELASQQAALYQNLGRLSDAAQLYRRVLADGGTPPDVRAKVANNLGIIEAQCGRPETALAFLDVAAAAAAEVGPAVVAIVAEGRAWVTVHTGRLTEGLDLFDEAVRLWEAARLPLGELYAEYADALIDLRLIPEASERALRAVEMLERQGVLLMAAEAQLRVAQLALLRKDLHAAVTAAEMAAAQLRRQGRASWAARARLVVVDARLEMGEIHPDDLRAARRAAGTLERAGMTSSAVEAYLSAGRIAAALGQTAIAVRTWVKAYELSRGAPLLVRLRGRLAAALAGRVQRRHDAVIHHGRAGVNDLARHRAALASTELRALASGHGAELGGLVLASLVQTHPPARVLDWMERTRAAALAVVDPPATEGIEEELGALRAVHAEILHSRRETGTEPADLLSRQAAIEERIRRATWTRRSSGDAGGAALSAATLRRLLDGQVLVEYDVLEGGVLAVVLEPRRTRVVPLGPVDTVRYELDALLFALRRLARRTSRATVSARDSADYSLGRLSDMLIKPLHLAEHPGLVVVPVGELQRIPWAALHAGPVSIAPSSSLWARSRLRQRAADAHVALIAGPELPGAAAEVHALQTLHDRPTVLVPPASRVDTVTRALDGAGLAHLACHGYIRADNPTFSSLLLSDGQLTLHELDERGIAPYRLVLAACESGSGVTYEGNEMLGFVGTLIAQGTAGVVASAVVVPDWDVVPLMRSLHEGVRRGATLAEALHAARATVDRKDPASFVSWCAFNAFGAA